MALAINPRLSSVRETATDKPRPRLTWKQGLISSAFGAWLIFGLFVDGWAHNHQKPESVFTPWHGLLYSGFAAAAWYAISIVRKAHVEGTPILDVIPVGHVLVLIGLAVFGVGASGDMAWHGIFGVEVSLAALLSPTHLVMFVGALLVLTGPFRAAWADGRQQSPDLRQFLPALVSLVLATALVAFFFQYVTPFRKDNYGTWVASYTGFVTRFPAAANGFAENIRIVGLTSVLITTVVYLAPLLLVLRRWRPPFGTATILFSAVTALVGGIDAYDRPAPLLAALVAGLVADALIRRLRPTADRPWSMHAVAAASSFVLWTGFFALYQLAYGIGWPAELWAGAVVVATLAGAGISLLVFPPALPPVPVSAAPAGRSPSRRTAG